MEVREVGPRKVGGEEILRREVRRTLYSSTCAALDAAAAEADDLA